MDSKPIALGAPNLPDSYEPIDLRRSRSGFAPANFADHLKPKSIFRLIKNRIKYLAFRQTWNIGVIKSPVSEVAGLEGSIKQKAAMEHLVWMQEEQNSFAADPFIMTCEINVGQYNIFYEHFDWKKKIGTIRLVKFFDDVGFMESTEILDSPYHLSYPFLIKIDGSIGIIPEHSESKDLSFYELNSSGGIFRKRTIGSSFEGVDPTFIYWNDRFWMFATSRGRNDNSHLDIFYADSIFGPWQPHSKNPVKVDRANARPAGQPIIFEGRLFRPAQDCSSTYGSAIIMNEVTLLNEKEFAERPVCDIRPKVCSRYDYGLHTISYADGITVIDGARLESKFHPKLDELSLYIS